MQTVGEVIRRPGIDSDLAGYLRSIPEHEELSFASIRSHIERGNGRFTELEGILLFLESVVRRSRGEAEW